jgi:hypothetical protein
VRELLIRETGDVVTPGEPVWGDSHRPRRGPISLDGRALPTNIGKTGCRCGFSSRACRLALFPRRVHRAIRGFQSRPGKRS